MGFFSWERETYSKFVHSEDRLLLIGAGTGRDVLPFVESGHEVVCVEPSTGSSLALREILRQRGHVSVVVVEEFVERANLPGTFNAIIFSRTCYSSIREASRRIAMLGELRRHLARHGRIIVFYAERPRHGRSPRAVAVSRLIAQLTRSDWRPEPNDHFLRRESDDQPAVYIEHWFSPEEIEAEARHAGLGVIAHWRPEGVSVIVLGQENGGSQGGQD